MCVRPGPTLKVVFFFSSSSSGGRVSPGKCTCAAKDMTIFGREGMMKLAGRARVGDGAGRMIRCFTSDCLKCGIVCGQEAQVEKVPEPVEAQGLASRDTLLNCETQRHHCPPFPQSSNLSISQDLI